MRKSILIYGLSLAILLVFLKTIEYKFMLRDISREWYIGIVAVFFLAIGTWAGIRIAEKYQQSRRQNLVLIRTASGQQNGDSLTGRELEVLQLLAEGLSNKEIADRLFISLNTVKTHISNIYSKLGVSRRTQAIIRAKELEILQVATS